MVKIIFLHVNQSDCLYYLVFDLWLQLYFCPLLELLMVLKLVLASILNDDLVFLL